MKFKNTIIAFLCIGLFSSCSLQVNLDYHADESGKIGIQMKTENTEMLKSFMGGMLKDSTLNAMSLMDSIPDISNSILPKIAAGMFGFQNPEIKDIDGGGKELGLTFNDISKLNGSAEKRDKSKVFFKKSKNALTIYMPMDLGTLGGNSDDSNPMMDMFASMIQAELNLTFERKVKKSNYKKIAFSDDRKQAKIRFNLSDFKELKGKKITFSFEK
jgi:hypothetical protein